VTSLNFAQRIESLNVKHLDGKKVTLSFKMYASQSLSGVSSALFFCSADDTGYGTTDVSNSLTVNSGLNTYEETFTLPSVASRGFELAIAFGSNLPSGATVEIAQVQLEVGDTATPFEHRRYSDEIQSCMRYFQNIETGNLKGARNTSTRLRITAPYTVPMRTSAAIARTSNDVVMQIDGNAITSTNTSASQGTTSGLTYMSFDLGGFAPSGSVTDRSYIGSSSSTNIAFTADAEL